MSTHPQPIAPVPEDTDRVARAAFPKGTMYMKMRDELGTIYQDEQFASLFPTRGQPAEAPGDWLWYACFSSSKACLTVRLPMPSAASCFAIHFDRKYALGLELTDPGFDFSVLSEVRARLINGGLEGSLLDSMLTQFKQLG